MTQRIRPDNESGSADRMPANFLIDAQTQSANTPAIKEKTEVKKSRQADLDRLGTGCPVTRRDFLDGTLKAGAMTGVAGWGLTACGEASQAPAFAPGELPPDWSGYSGVGDYARANGNIYSVVNAAHGIRDGVYHQPSSASDSEQFDLVIVGGGLSGLFAAHAFAREAPDRTVLVLDNHAMFGGEAKGNSFDVDGYRISAPQGSNGFAVPGQGPAAEIWRDIGMPTEFGEVPVPSAVQDIGFAEDNFMSILHAYKHTSIGYSFPEARGELVKDVITRNFANAPIPEGDRQSLAALFSQTEFKAPPEAGQLPAGADFGTWRAALAQSRAGR